LKQLRFTPRARDDIFSIRVYTELEWGIEETQRYIAALSKRFDELMQYPEIGVQNEQLGRAIRTLAAERHVIIYRIDHDAVVILAVRHQSQRLRL